MTAGIFSRISNKLVHMCQAVLVVLNVGWQVAYHPQLVARSAISESK